MVRLRNIRSLSGIGTGLEEGKLTSDGRFGLFVAEDMFTPQGANQSSPVVEAMTILNMHCN